MWSLINILIFIAAALLLLYPLLEEKIKPTRKKILKKLFIVLIIINILITAYTIESQDLKDIELNKLKQQEILIKDFRIDVEYTSNLNQETNEAGGRTVGTAFSGFISNSTKEIEIDFNDKELVKLRSDYNIDTEFPDKKTKVIKIEFTPTNDVLINKNISFLERYDTIILPFEVSPLHWDSPTVEIRVKIIINGKLVYDDKDIEQTSSGPFIIYYHPKDLFSNIEQKYLSIT